MHIFTKTIAAIMFTVAVIIVAGCNKSDELNNVSGSFNGHDYVDLGLPSGTLWATCNVGADSPEVFGNYFAWGETAPKEIYDWNSYKYSIIAPEQDRYELNKYCTDSISGYNGFVDGLTVLESVDDAATICWGDDWRTPTKDQWAELLENTTFTWVEENGVKGRLVKGCNGSIITYLNELGVTISPLRTATFAAPTNAPEVNV